MANAGFFAPEQQKRFFKDEIDAIEMGPLEVDTLDEEDELGDGYMYADGRYQRT